ncbi:ketosteroid isomerase-like protein [Candidatus Nitrososphaera evergladensis SR1]|uniref:Ketosteroid isomerase-like protein n=1 Tax=Candidatus Nitrososphaera evergladensis SR1 TaxID=1459636 RepID=A0A075MSC9_9ARCH|nr:nuclear transport factor 2 family protein [Candidatus Nitrososphaera evergladensis]AIF84063.1 ketosteroid isomerase-like protein [Candidatus Nitrososphaera evergladensis SR1]
MQKNEQPAKSSKEVVISFLESLNNGDLKSARSCVSDDFTFKLPQGSFDSAEAYFKAAEQAQQAHQEPYRFDVKKVFTDGSDVCVFNDVIAGDVTLFACGWYRVEGGKIRSLKLVYDPRPLLQRKQ